MNFLTSRTPTWSPGSSKSDKKHQRYGVLRFKKKLNPQVLGGCQGFFNFFFAFLVCSIPIFFKFENFFGGHRSFRVVHKTHHFSGFLLHLLTEYYYSKRFEKKQINSILLMFKSTQSRNCLGRSKE